MAVEVLVALEMPQLVVAAVPAVPAVREQRHRALLRKRVAQVAQENLQALLVFLRFMPVAVAVE